VIELSPWSPVKAIAVFAVVMLAAIRYKRGHHPFPRMGAANHITAARAALVAIVAGFIGEAALPRTAWIAVAMSGVVMILDGVDGWVSRRTQMASDFGARFDMEVDALLIQVLAILSWQYGKAGAWVLFAGLLRYLFVASGLIWPWLRRPLPPSVRGRAICVVQIVALLLALMPSIAPPASTTIAAVGLLALAYSFAVDTRRLWRHA
jgi:phosphatidylglycerophosphate synthase